MRSESVIDGSGRSHALVPLAVDLDSVECNWNSDDTESEV
jgi:hypothetical protein